MMNMVKLGRFVKASTRKNKGLVCTDVYSVTNSAGFISSTDYFSKEVFSKELSNYKLVRPGMIAYNPSRINVGSVAVRDKCDQAIVSPLYVAFEVDELVKSRFVEMFGTAQEPKYAVVPIEDLCSAIVDCPHETPKYEGCLVHPAIRTSELTGTSISWETMKYVSDEEYLRRIRRMKPLPGDVVYAREGTYGNAAVLPEGHDFCLGQRTMLFRPKSELCLSNYLLHALTSVDVKRQSDELNVGSTVPHVNVRDAKRFEIPMPPIRVQQEFAAFVHQVDKLKLAST